MAGQSRVPQTKAWKAGRKAGRKAGVKMAKLSKPMKKAVEVLINGKEETKYRAEDMVIPGSILPSLGTFQQFSSAITSTSELYACIPRLAQGTDDFQRIGNTIAPVSCHLDLIVQATPDNNNQSVDKWVHLFVLESVSVKSLDNLSAVPILQLFENGAGGYLNADGTTKMSMYPLNRNEFRVLHHKRIRLFKGFGQANNTYAPDAGQTDGTSAANTGNKRIRLNVKLPQKLKYDVAAQQYPVNSAPFFCVAWERNDYGGDSASIVSTYVEGRVHLRYKDA